LPATGREEQTVHNKLNSKRINGAALEMIMRDVLDGMFDFTHQACRGSETAKMEIIAVEKALNSSDQEASATIIKFPAKPSTG
jgi:hypothetical protein